MVRNRRNPVQHALGIILVSNNLRRLIYEAGTAKLVWIALICGVPLLLLGAHGLYAYFYRLDTLGALFSGADGRLFFAVNVPVQFWRFVSWMTARGVQSPIIPGIFAFSGGAMLWFVYNNRMGLSLPRLKRHGRQEQHGGQVKYRSVRWRETAIKVLLNLSILFGLILLVWHGYRVFSEKTSPLAGAISFLLGAVVLGMLVWLFRRKYAWLKPSFKVTTFVVLLVALIFAFAGVEPLQGYKDTLAGTISRSTAAVRGSLTPSVTSGIEPQTKTIVVGTIPWEVKLTSARWSGQGVSAAISVTNKGKRPADFPYEDVDPIGVVVDFAVRDSYGMWYSTEGSPQFNVQKIYPGENRIFRPTFIVSSRSGNVVLYVTRYTGTSRMLLFDLGAPK